jgi:predicted dehydrogenase
MLKRRNYLKGLSLTAAAAVFQPYSAFAAEPRKFRIAAVGIGGKGASDLSGMSKHPLYELVAVCDVDKTFFKKYQGVAQFQDYREMFAKMADKFDGVLIATPDHMHAPIALLALHHDKHVYLQKPLAQDIGECRLLAEAAAKKPHLATQMGIQVHGHPAYRSAVEWIQGGVIGKVEEVHSWSGKGWGGEFQPKAATKPPESLDWDLYCGVAGKRAYVQGWYHRGNWRKWFAFGSGTQGDMGCHIVDPVFGALEFKEPISVVSRGPKPFEQNFALISKVEYEFKGTKFTVAKANFTWYNGSLRPKQLKGVPKSVKLPSQGSVFVGEKGTLILPHVGTPKVYNPDGSPVAVLPKAAKAVNHFLEWIDVAVGRKEATGTPFSFSGPLTEAVLLGVVINRWPDKKFAWNAKQCKFAGEGKEVIEANNLLAPKWAEGFELPRG